jgi:hypothetical protein
MSSADSKQGKLARPVRLEHGARNAFVELTRSLDIQHVERQAVK